MNSKMFNVLKKVAPPVTASYFTSYAGLELLQEVSYLNLEKYKEGSRYKGCSHNINI